MLGMIHPDEELNFLESKKVSKYDLGGKLALPVILMDHVWPDGVPYSGTREFTVLDINLKRWTFVCKLRRNERGNPKPEVSGSGWREFIKQKQIRVKDDELFFYRPPAPPTNEYGAALPVFLISVKREIKLGGETFSDHIRL